MKIKKIGEVTLTKFKQSYILYKLHNTPFDYKVAEGIVFPQKSTFKILEKGNIKKYLDPNDYGIANKFDLSATYIVLECIEPNNMGIASEDDVFKFYGRTYLLEEYDIIILKERNCIFN